MGGIDLVCLPKVLNLGLVWSCGFRFHLRYHWCCSKAWKGFKLELLGTFDKFPMSRNAYVLGVFIGTSRDGFFGLVVTIVLQLVVDLIDIFSLPKVVNIELVS